MIYKIHEQNVLTEGSIDLKKSIDKDLRIYRFHLLQGETDRHGTRIKIYLKSSHLATYRINRSNGNISLIDTNRIPNNHQSSIEMIVRELSYGCYKLIYKITKDRLDSDMDMMQYYADIIVSSSRQQMHKNAERIRAELDAKIY